jgi:hypothetical protein
MPIPTPKYTTLNVVPLVLAAGFLGSMLSQYNAQVDRRNADANVGYIGQVCHLDALEKTVLRHHLKFEELRYIRQTLSSEHPQLLCENIQDEAALRMLESETSSRSADTPSEPASAPSSNTSLDFST